MKNKRIEIRIDELRKGMLQRIADKEGKSITDVLNDLIDSKIHEFYMVKEVNR